MTSSNTSIYNKVHEADELAELLEHLGWTEVLKPKLSEYRKQLEGLVVQAVLGTVVTQNSCPVSKEQLAGRADALRWLELLIERVIREGTHAADRIQLDASYGVQ